MPRSANVYFSSEVDVTLDCVHTSARPDSKHGMSDPGSATRSTGAAAISCFALTQHALEGLVEELRRQPVAECQQFMVWRTRLVRSRIAPLHSRSGLPRTVEPSCPGDSTRRLILDHERRTEPRLIGCVFKILWPHPAEAQPDWCMATIASPSCAASGGATRIRLVSRCPPRVRWRSPPERASAMRRSPVPPGAPGPPPRAGASPAASRRTRA
jgi:hypothetical protein